METRNGIEWRVADGRVPYPEALAEMEARVAAIQPGEAGELIWLLEHPPVYTAVMDVNATDPVLDGTVSDNMTMVDGATGNDTGMANDTMGNMAMGNGM